MASFGLFAAVYVATRVAAYPLYVMPAGVVAPLRHIPDVLQAYPGVYATMNMLLALLYGMQWLWLPKIVR